MAPKRIAIIGAGAAGMSAAYALSVTSSKSKDKSGEGFEVVLFERSSACGGMATSSDIDETKYGASYINDGVQGASPVFYNTFKVFEELGFGSSEVGMQCSFGKGDDEFWSNVFPSSVIDKFQPDIKRFGKVLTIIKTFEPVFALISVERMLKLFRFSPDFGEVIVYPLVALFFGTGNQTPFISSAILERVFKDPSMRLFEYSATSFLASIPEMRAFPRLSLLYETWQKVIEDSGNVDFKLSHEVTGIKRSSKGVEINYRQTKGTDNGQQVVDPGPEQEDKFDDVIICTDADATLKILGQGASWIERKVLGNVKYLWDITITHSDLEYMQKHYNVTYSDDLASTSRDDDKEAQEQFKFAKDHFRPLYYIRSYPSDKKKIEMSFDLTHYQPQFKGESPYGPDHTGIPPNHPTAQLPSKPSLDESAASSIRKEGQDDEGNPEPPLKKHVFQTIFLDKDGSRDLWSIGEIKEEEIVMKKWWKQQSHRWQHYGGTVPWMMFLNGKHHTYFAGAWTILNMHEIGIVSGFAAAYRLGATYPFVEDGDAKRLFALYLGASHGCRMRKQDRQGFFM
ncbi:BZ3500_MvSof-1268-A1-R1_Chr8-2g10241 [Microbotryum saponariae]|uniref:BZ3500_MvSof-1268-A1-R1_Chr8-2g10241 protein n=1 Tax=Microbotryum saponariae TaxID=289078 RepID=A0A2X0KRL6_9BASI|nr:BZ3500_MvSof-1268-A1-R1_Chr8-2g10241 [Microbotryum saponariae]SDA02039.1 BZ3501_MvSof-1269-A2-R1_Chr8-2g09991 [Microbotryum saponariae]